MAGITKRAYRDPFSGHVITVTALAATSEAPSPMVPTAAPDTPVDPEGLESVGDEPEAEPTREYTEEEDRVNRCIAGVRRGRI